MYKSKIESLKKQKEGWLVDSSEKSQVVQKKVDNLNDWIQYFEHKQKQWERAVKR